MKNTIWTRGKLALFPDRVFCVRLSITQKHLRELIAQLPCARAVMLYFINRGDFTSFAPGDQVSGQLLREATALRAQASLRERPPFGKNRFRSAPL